MHLIRVSIRVYSCLFFARVHSCLFFKIDTVSIRVYFGVCVCVCLFVSKIIGHKLPIRGYSCPFVSIFPCIFFKSIANTVEHGSGNRRGNRRNACVSIFQNHRKYPYKKHLKIDTCLFFSRYTRDNTIQI